MTAKDVFTKVAVAGALIAGAALATAESAAAEPPAPEVPADPAVPTPAPPAPNGIPPLSDLTSPLAQSGAAPGQASGGLPLNPLAGGNPDNAYFLAQNPAPEASGGAATGTPPNLSAFNNAWLLPQNLVPSAPGEGQIYDVPPGEENANISPIDPFKRMHHMHVDGYLKGGLLGQAPQQQLGEPLPGTAPPPGTSVPSGLVQYLPDPAPPPDGSVPPPPPG